MPKIPTKPSLNHQVIKNMTKEELIEMHPDACEDHLTKEWEKAGGKPKKAIEVKE